MAAVTLELTPDLGWVNRTAMFNAAINPALIQVAVSSMIAATATRLDKKTPQSLVFSIDAVDLQIPRANAGRLAAGNGKWFFRTVDGADVASDISEFELITKL